MLRIFRVGCIAFGLLAAGSADVRAQYLDVEPLSKKISDELVVHLTQAQVKVAYVGMNGARAYLSGDLGPLEAGQEVRFYRDGFEVGKGILSGIHDLAAWVQIDTQSVGKIGRDDHAVARLPAPFLRIAPFFVDESREGLPKLDGRGRILRSLILYNLKRAGLAVGDASLTVHDVDVSGLPTPEVLKRFDTEGVLVIGRVLPDEQSPQHYLTVGIVLFDLAQRDVRFARSYLSKALSAFSPVERPVRDAAKAEPPAPPEPVARDIIPAVAPKPRPPEIPEGVLRMYLSTSPRFSWPPLTPADFTVLQLTAPTLPDAAAEWIADTHGWITVRLIQSEEPVYPLRAQDIVGLLGPRVSLPKVRAAIGRVGWSAISDAELLLKLDRPVPDMRNRMEDPFFSLADTDLTPVAPGFAPYEVVDRGSRKIVLKKNPVTPNLSAWSDAPDRVEFTIEWDPRARAKGFEGGEVDIHEILDEEYMKYGEGSGRRTFKSAPEELVVLAFNLARPALKSVHIRRMMVMAMDRKTAVDMFLSRRGEPAEGFLPTGAEGVPMLLTKLPERSVLAAQLLAQDLTDTTPISLIFPMEDPQYALIAESIRSDLAALNVQVTPRAQSWREYGSDLESGTYDLALVSLTPQRPYRLWMQQQFSSDGMNNLYGYRSPIVDAMLTEDGDIGAAHDVLISDLPAVPLFWLSHRIALGPRVDAAWPSRFPRKFFSSVRLKK